MSNKYETYKNIVRCSVFSKDCYEVNVDIKRFFSSVYWYAGKGESSSDVVTPSEVLKDITPVFQRDNNKWSLDMKIKFVENVYKGLDTYLCLYSISTDQAYDNCMILDGLQRSTALSDFFEGKFKIFEENIDGGLTFEELSNMNTRINKFKIRIYEFNNLIDVVQFYIDMNENITHSYEDITKAKDYLKKLKGEVK